MTGHDVTDRATAPFVEEGTGDGALRIYFESEHSKQEYLKIAVRTPAACSLKLYRQIEEDEEILWD